MTHVTPAIEKSGDGGRSTLRQVAYESFMESLSYGQIKPGQMVSQRELCEMLSLPMGPMREALKRLEAENIVRLIPQRGIEIVDIDEQVIDEVYEMRRLVELRGIEVFARDVPLALVDDLRIRTERAIKIEQEAAGADIVVNRQLTKLDHEMHYMFVGALKNRFAEDIHRRMLMQLQLVRFINKLRQISAENALKEHLQILKLLVGGKGEAAKEELSRHLYDSWRRTKRL